MKILAAVILAAALSACGGGNSGYSDSYSGSITETYSCANSNPPSFVLSNETISYSVDGNGNAVVTIASCPGDSLAGTVSGDQVTILSGQATFTCNQTDAAGDTISITAISGTLTQDANGGLDVNLSETATIDGDSCGGVASGTLN